MKLYSQVFVCKDHGAINDKGKVVEWSETQWYVYCDKCTKWLGVTAKPATVN